MRTAGRIPGPRARSGERWQYGPMVRSGISAEALDPAAAVASVTGPSCGAIATFIGTVRETAAAPGAEGRQVIALDYEAHPVLAPQRLEEIAQDAAQRWNLAGIYAVHRTGRCELGEPTVVIACSAAHRGDALAACRWIIDTVKTTVPIFKREIFADGAAWVSEGSGEVVG